MKIRARTIYCNCWNILEVGARIEDSYDRFRTVLDVKSVTELSKSWNAVQRELEGIKICTVDGFEAVRPL